MPSIKLSLVIYDANGERDLISRGTDRLFNVIVWNNICFNKWFVCKIISETKSRRPKNLKKSNNTLF